VINVVEWWAPPLVVIGTILGAFGAVYFKKAANKLSLSLKILTNRELILGIILYGLSSGFYIAGVRGGELSVIYPLVATSYIWVCLLSIRMLGEKMNKLKWLGIFLILAGVSIIGFAPV
jgi:uncharacterized membrane protein